MAESIENIVQQVVDIGREYDSIVDKAILRTCGYSTMQVRILMFMAKRGNVILQKELESVLNLSRPAISQLLDAMVSNGLIYREGVERDKRMKRLSLTPDGKAIAKKTMVEVSHAYRKIGSALNEDEIAQLGTILDKLKNNLESDNSDKTAF